MSKKHYNSQTEELRILNVIKHRVGPQNAIGSSGFGINDASVRGTVQRLRRAGHPICTATGRGYYYASTSAEVLDTIQYIESLKIGLEQTLDALSKTYNDYRINELGGIVNEQ